MRLPHGLNALLLREQAPSYERGHVPARAYDQRHGRSIHIVRHLIESDHITLAENEELMVQFTANLGEHVDNRLKPGFAAFRQGS